METRHAASSVVVDTRRSPHCRLRPVAISDVRLEDGFWAPRLRLARQVTLPLQYEECERTGRLDNFRWAAGKKAVEHRGRIASDSDVYKWLEAASYALAAEPDAALGRLVDAVVADVAAAQEPDGFLHTYFAGERAAQRWADPIRQHHLYVGGHLIQAAVAHHRATGKTSLLDVAVRLADLLCQTFGPQARRGTGSHPEIEMALVELYRETGRCVYLDRAGFFLDQRGRQPPVVGGEAQSQDHLPVREQREIVGHAVCATYLACGMADVCAETGDSGLETALAHLWESAFGHKAYVTGGLGARWRGEAFGADYELPNDRAYAETCAAIGGLMWNWRMLLATGEARYADWLETALHNGVLSGIGLDGRSYFYQNPLADRGQHRRQPWFDRIASCCPPNVARTLMSVPGYLYSTTMEGLWVHLYAAGRVRTKLPAGERVAVEVQTRYPWDGLIQLTVDQAPDAPFSVFLRVPGWCRHPDVRLNGAAAGADVAPGSYVELHRTWRPGDTVELHLPMPVQRVASHLHVQANAGRVALRRGPLVYCVEAADHAGVDVWDLVLPADGRLAAEAAPHLLGGVTVIRGKAMVEEAAQWDGHLYLADADRPAPAARTVELLAIPYYAWANRSPGPMQVWVRAGQPAESDMSEEL